MTRRFTFLGQLQPHALRRWVRASQVPFARTWVAVVGAILGLLAFLLLPGPSLPSTDDGAEQAGAPSDAAERAR